MCTCMSVSGRNQKDIETNELSDFPLNLATNKVNYQDSSVTSTVWWSATKKTVYRNGKGCTLINYITEQQLHSQSFEIPVPPLQNTNTIAWPNGDKVVDTFPIAVNKNKLDAVVDSAFEEPYAGKSKKRER